MKSFKLLVIGICSVCCLVLSASGGELSQRLIGKWQSDKEKSVNSIRFPDKVSDEQKTKSTSVFGKLILAYTEDEIFVLKNLSSKLGKNGSKYSVVKEDGDKLSIQVLATADQQSYSMTFQFISEDVYRTKLGGVVGYEYFNRIK